MIPSRRMSHFALYLEKFKVKRSMCYYAFYFSFLLVVAQLLPALCLLELKSDTRGRSPYDER